MARIAADRLARTTSQTGGKLVWSSVTFDPKHLNPNLRDDETPLQWLERRCELHRLACAPVVFPRIVSEVHAWHAHAQEVGHITLIIVLPVGAAMRTFVSPRPQGSQSQAHKTACAPAKDYVSGLIRSTEAAPPS